MRRRGAITSNSGTLRHASIMRLGGDVVRHVCAVGKLVAEHGIALRLWSNVSLLHWISIRLILFEKLRQSESEPKADDEQGYGNPQIPDGRHINGGDAKNRLHPVSAVCIVRIIDACGNGTYCEI